MAFDCREGFSFRLSGHLRVVIAELPGSPTQVLVVYLTTKKENSDTTVVLKSGDHNFIKHDTVVSYADSRIFDKDDLIDRIERKLFKPDKPFDIEKVRIMQRGLLDSPYTPKAIKDLYRKASQNNNPN